MDDIKSDAENAIKEAIALLSKVHSNNASNVEIEAVLKSIITMCRKILADEQSALKRIGIDVSELFGEQRKAQESLQRIGLDFRALFGR